MTDNQHEANQFNSLESLRYSWQTAFLQLALVANKNSHHKGFYEDQDYVHKHLAEARMDAGEVDLSEEVMPWLRSTAIQASIARMHEELSEAVQAVRKGNPPDDHMPEYTGLEAELADVIIRILDMAGEFKLNVGPAVIDKMLYNSKRPHKHGKNS